MTTQKITVLQLIDHLSDMIDEHGNRDLTIHYIPSTRIVKIAMVGVFDGDNIIVSPSINLDVTTSQD